MNKYEMMALLKRLALDTLRVVNNLPATRVNQKISDQICRSCMSAPANYRAACRGKSTADFINKLKIVEEELDETMFHYEMLIEMNPAQKEEIEKLIAKYNRVLSMIVKAIKTSRQNLLLKNQK